MLKGLLKIGDLKTRKNPRKLLEIAAMIQNRDDLVSEAVLLQRNKQLTLDPHRVYRPWGEYKEEPVAPLQGGTDLIMPLFCAQDVCLAVPNRDAVATQNFREGTDKLLI